MFQNKIKLANIAPTFTRLYETGSSSACQCAGCVARAIIDLRLLFCVMNVRYERGVYLPAQDLWLDPWEAKRFAFVSHAHSDHIAPHDEIIVSERTARLMQARLPGTRIEHVLPFG